MICYFSDTVPLAVIRVLLQQFIVFALYSLSLVPPPASTKQEPVPYWWGSWLGGGGGRAVAHGPDLLFLPEGGRITYFCRDSGRETESVFLLFYFIGHIGGVSCGQCYCKAVFSLMCRGNRIACGAKGSLCRHAVFTSD